MKSKSLKFIEEFSPLSPEAIQSAMNQLLQDLDLDIEVVDVDVDLMGGITVSFSDGDGELDVFFSLSEEGYPEASIISDDENEDDVMTVSLESFDFKVVSTGFGTYVDLIDNSWLNSTAMTTILAFAEMGESIDEASRLVIRNGKKVRLPIARKTKKKVMSYAQRLGITRANVKRKAKQGRTSQKMKKSLEIRKRSAMNSSPSNGLHTKG